MRFFPHWCRNEKEVESKFIAQFLLPQLGYRYQDWYQEVRYKNIRIDFLLIPAELDKVSFKYKRFAYVILEAKNPREKLDVHIPKFRLYLKTLKVRYGLITNAQEIRLYKRQNKNIHLLFQWQGKDIHHHIAKLTQIIGKESLIQQVDRLVKNAKLKPKNSTKLSPQIKSPKQPKNMKVIAVYHNKGGVGKTTTVVNLAAALAHQGAKVLIIDLDSQANTTFAVGLAKFTDELQDDLKDNNVFHLIKSSKKYPIKEVVRKTSYTQEHIDAIPSHISLMNEERNLVDVAASRTRIRYKLEEVKNDYDYVFIDTPPSLNLYAKIAIITADYLIIPSDLKPFANEGLKNVISFMAEINDDREAFGFQPIELLGVLPCKISGNARFNQYTLPKRRKVITERYNLPLFETNIYERDDLAKALDKTVLIDDLEIPDPKSIFEYKPDSLAASEFEALALELKEKIGESR